MSQPGADLSSGVFAGRKQKPKSKYDAVIGRTVDIPAPIFSVDIPDLYYRGTVTKKDPAHPGAALLADKMLVSLCWV